MRWYQYSLRSLLVLTTTVAVAGSWFAWKRQQVERRRAVVGAIEQLGGGVYFDYQQDDDGLPVFNATPPGPAWLRGLLGDDFFAEPTTLSFFDRPVPSALWPHVEALKTLRTIRFGATTITDEDLVHLTGLTQLSNLYVGEVPITGAGLRHLAGLPRLRKLCLPDSPITDANLRHVAALKHLQALDLTETRVTDVGLAQLQSLTNLECLLLGSADKALARDVPPRSPTYLEQLSCCADETVDSSSPPLLQAGAMVLRYLANRGVSDSGLVHLRALPKLHCLSLQGDGFSDAGLIPLGDMRQLTELHLYDTRLTDGGLAQLRTLNQLERVNLAGTKVTDRGLGFLKQMSSLKWITLGGTAVTPVGVTQLQKALPSCTIDTGFTGMPSLY